MNPADGNVDREVDFLILGGGSAGCVLADRLSEAGKYEVLLAEAGPADRNPLVHVPAGFLQLIDHPELSWRYRSEPDMRHGGKVIAYPQGRMLGGTGSLNGMLYVRSAQAEHERWVAEGCTGWAFQDVLPFYEAIENVNGASRSKPLPVASFAEQHPLSGAFLEACSQAGLAVRDTLNGPEREGAAAFMQNRRGRFRGGPAQSYLRRARGRRNLHVLTNVLVRRVVFEGKRAVAAEIGDSARPLRVRARKEIVVSCGTIRSPQLLQLSGIGPAPLLRSLGIPVVVDRPGVGANLRDHYSVRLSQRVRGIGTLNERTRGLLLAAELLNYVLYGRGLLTLGASTCAAFARSSEWLGHPDLQLSFAPASFQAGTYQLERQPGMTISVYYSYPESAGSVHARSTDPAHAPVITSNYLSDARDCEVLLAGLRLARRIASMPALQQWIVGETLPGPEVTSDEELLAYSRLKGVSGYHLVGTCRMGGGEDAVVDPRLKVRGVTGLRVVDASVLPTCTSGNSNAPTIMVAEKGAEMILADAAGPDRGGA